MSNARIYNFVWQAMVASALFGLTGCGPAKESAAPAAADLDINSLLQQGKELYGQTCMTCHYAGDGGGQNPSLLTSATVKGPSEGLIKVILEGQSGISLVNGQKLNGIMPAQSYMSDAEVAAVATYVRLQLGKVETAVQPSEVARFRQK